MPHVIHQTKKIVPESWQIAKAKYKKDKRNNVSEKEEERGSYIV